MWWGPLKRKGLYRQLLYRQVNLPRFEGVSQSIALLSLSLPGTHPSWPTNLIRRQVDLRRLAKNGADMGGARIVSDTELDQTIPAGRTALQGSFGALAAHRPFKDCRLSAVNGNPNT